MAEVIGLGNVRMAHIDGFDGPLSTHPVPLLWQLTVRAYFSELRRLISRSVVLIFVVFLSLHQVF